jgi:hypothetical protein
MHTSYDKTVTMSSAATPLFDHEAENKEADEEEQSPKRTTRDAD